MLICGITQQEGLNGAELVGMQSIQSLESFT